MASGETGGCFFMFATSPYVEPTETMNFPYHNVEACLIVAYDSKNEWAYIAFSEAPNITDDEIKDGYNLIRTRIKWEVKIHSFQELRDSHF